MLMKNNEEDDLAWLIYSPCNALTASNFYAVLCGFVVCGVCTVFISYFPAFEWVKMASI